ncbi:MAG: hypothetical protein WA912_06895 [Ornithinimicrobium sp.]
MRQPNLHRALTGLASTIGRVGHQVWHIAQRHFTSLDLGSAAMLGSNEDGDVRAIPHDRRDPGDHVSVDWAHRRA